MAGGRKHLEQEAGCASLLSLQWIFPEHTSFFRLFVNILPDLKTYSKKGHFATYCVDLRSLLPFTWRLQFTSHQVDSLWISRGEWVDSFSSYLHFQTDISCWIKKRIQFPGQPQHPRDGAFCLWTQEGNSTHCTQPRIRSGTATATRFSLQSNVYLKPFPPPSFFFDCIYIAALRLHQHSPIFFFATKHVSSSAESCSILIPFHFALSPSFLSSQFYSLIYSLFTVLSSFLCAFLGECLVLKARSWCCVLWEVLLACILSVMPMLLKRQPRFH